MFLVNICYVSTRSIPLIVYIEFFSLILTIYNLLLSPPPSPILICRWWLLLRLEYSSETRFFFFGNTYWGTQRVVTSYILKRFLAVISWAILTELLDTNILTSLLRIRGAWRLVLEAPLIKVVLQILGRKLPVRAVDSRVMTACRSSFRLPSSFEMSWLINEL